MLIECGVVTQIQIGKELLLERGLIRDCNNITIFSQSIHLTGESSLIGPHRGLNYELMGALNQTAGCSLPSSFHSSS